MGNDYFDNWFWASNKTDMVCPGMGDAKCRPPNACARDPNTGKEYCCDKQKKGGSVCWTLAEKCSSSGSTINCGTGNQLYCCLDKREKCSETPNQTGICWNTADDTLNNITYADLDKAWSSASSSKTAATSWAFDPVELAGFTAPPEASTTATSTNGAGPVTPNPATPTAPNPATPTPAPGSDGSSASLGGGAIAGIAIGSVAGVLILGLLVWFARRRQKQHAAAAGGANHIAAYSEMDGGKSPGASPGATTIAAYRPVPGYSPGAAPAPGSLGVPGHGVQEHYKPPVQEPQELATHYNAVAPQELPGDTSTYAGSMHGPSPSSVSSTPQAAYTHPHAPPR